MEDEARRGGRKEAKGKRKRGRNNNNHEVKIKKQTLHPISSAKVNKTVFNSHLDTEKLQC